MQGVVQIFGYMRSGTSMCRRLLHKHPEIYVTNEIGRSLYPQLVKFLRSSESAFREMPTAAIRNRWSSKRVDLLRELWLGLSKFSEDPAAARKARIIGNKTPRAEFCWSVFESAFSASSPKYIYCVRDPAKILRSKMNMHLSGRDFDYSLRDLEKSLGVMFDIRRTCSSRLFLFSVDEYARRPAATTSSLLKFLDADSDPALVRHMIDQPAANAMSQQIRSRRASGEAVDGVVELTPTQKRMIDCSSTFRDTQALLRSIEQVDADV